MQTHPNERTADQGPVQMTEGTGWWLGIIDQPLPRRSVKTTKGGLEAARANCDEVARLCGWTV